MITSNHYYSGIASLEIKIKPVAGTEKKREQDTQYT